MLTKIFKCNLVKLSLFFSPSLLCADLWQLIGLLAHKSFSANNKKFLTIRGCKGWSPVYSTARIRDSTNISYCTRKRENNWMLKGSVSRDYRIRKYLSLFIRGPDRFESWKKLTSKISWHTPFKIFQLLILLVALQFAKLVDQKLMAQVAADNLAQTPVELVAP